MKSRRTAIRAAFMDACQREIEALKPGNVHQFADGHGMSASDFLTSAEVSAGPLTDPALPVGERILEAVRATRMAVNTNTNLGILLLCAPVARAAESGVADLRSAIRKVLDALTMDDTAAVFHAIATANPGGLGSGGENDVRKPPRIGLLQAMRQASAGDRIAHQYVTGYADIFETGLPTLEQSLARGESGMWPAVAVYLAFLGTFPDSHVGRKFGAPAADSVRDEAAAIRSRLPGCADEKAQVALLLDFDASLKRRNINPGTSADLTVCCLFVHSLTERLA